MLNIKHVKKNFSRKIKVAKKISALREDRNVWSMARHKSWGNTISYFGGYHPEGFNIQGHLSDIRTGDELLIDMVSGNKVSCVITGIRFERDPKDMFYGSAVPIEYLRCIKNTKKYKNIKVGRYS